MPLRNPRHLAEHRLPWRLMLVAFGLTFAVLAALVASAALVPKAPLAPSAVQQLPAETTSLPLPADPPSVAPSSAGPGSSSTSTTVPQEPPAGVSPVALAAQAPTTAPRATTPATTPRPSGPPATPPPPAPTTAPTTTELPPAPVISVAPTTTVEPTTTTAAPTTNTVEATTTTAALAPTTTAGETTTTAQLLVTTTQPPAAGVLLAPILGLLYLLRAHLPAPGRHARPGRYRLPQVRSRRATWRPPRRARPRP
jgi:outer membrane biosynthesis protein TonB